MNGLLSGIGVGLAYSAALLIPLPILIIGGMTALVVHADRQSKQQKQAEALQAEDPLTDAEMEELEIFSSLIDNAPDDGARQALIEEFYPGFINSL